MSDMISVSLPVDLARLIDQYRGRDQSWSTMACEWIDNSLDANARNIEILFEGNVLKVIDDGDGCDDLSRMEGLGSSGLRPASPSRSSLYGIGGVAAQIHASDGRVDVCSITKDFINTFKIDWRNCVHGNEIKAKQNSVPNELHRKSGTHITIQLGKPVDAEDIDKLVRHVGFYYSARLRQKRRVTLGFHGDTTAVRPYDHPRFLREVSAEIDVEGMEVRVRGGLTRPGIKANPHPGLWFRWKHRVMCPHPIPGFNGPKHRLFVMVDLPDEWKNINPTKDGFTHKPKALLKALAECLKEITEAAMRESRDVETAAIIKEVEARGNIALGGGGRVKGRRPGNGVNPGTVAPANTGRQHRRFSFTQPGDKAEGNGHLPPKRSRNMNMRVFFEKDIGEPITIEVGGEKERTYIVTLDKGYRDLAVYEQDISLVDHMTRICFLALSHFIVEQMAGGQMDWGWKRGESAMKIFGDMLARLDPSRAVEKVAGD